MSNLLLVEDDRSLGSTLFERLGKEGYQVDWFRNKHDALSGLAKNRFDLAILDIGLPDGSGFELASAIREKSRTPFIFMTAASDAENRLQGFELGAEEFIPKPFHLKELLMRVDHVLKNHSASDVLALRDQQVDFTAMRVVAKDGSWQDLTAKENRILRILMTESPRVISREEILNSVWGADKFPTNRTIDNIIVRLRQILGESSGVIKSVRGVGYQWLVTEKENGE